MQRQLIGKQDNSFGYVMRDGRQVYFQTKLTHFGNAVDGMLPIFEIFDCQNIKYNISNLSKINYFKNW